MHQGSAGFSKSIIDKKKDPPGQLYNLKEDLSESNNRWAAHPEKVGELRKKLDGVIKGK